MDFLFCFFRRQYILDHQLPKNRETIFRELWEARHFWTGDLWKLAFIAEYWTSLENRNTGTCGASQETGIAMSSIIKATSKKKASGWRTPTNCCLNSPNLSNRKWKMFSKWISLRAMYSIGVCLMSGKCTRDNGNKQSSVQNNWQRQRASDNS